MYKLMIAEDNPAALKELCDEFRWDKYGLCLTGAFSDGKELLEHAVRDMPNVVLSDIFMPVMDGISLASALRELSKDVKIIFISSCADFESAQKALLMRVSGYLLKPFEENQIDHVMMQVMQELKESDAGEQGPEIATTEGQEKGLKMPKDYVGRMKEFIREHYMENISMMDVSASVFLSSNYANLKFTQKCGCTISEYITKCRIAEAKRLLSETDFSVIQIGQMVGYNTKTSFYLAFKRSEGVSPMDYRKNKGAAI